CAARPSRRQCCRRTGPAEQACPAGARQVARSFHDASRNPVSGRNRVSGSVVKPSTRNFHQVITHRGETVGTAVIPAEWKNTIEHKAVTAIRTLAMDAVQQANSGHPGTPVAMAPVVYTLWQRFLRFDPQDPIWPNRDR